MHELELLKQGAALTLPRVEDGAQGSARSGEEEGDQGSPRSDEDPGATLAPPDELDAGRTPSGAKLDLAAAN